MLRFENVHLQYGPVEALSAIDCELPDRGLVLIVGPNGAGKSSFLDILSGAVRPTAGQIVSEKGVHLKQATLRRRASRAFQRNVIPDTTVLGLIDFAHAYRTPRDLWRRPGPGSIPAEERDLLSATGIAAWHETELLSLSGGQQRLCMLVAAFLRPSSLLLLDEPLAGVSRLAWEEFERLLAREIRHRLVVVVDHESERLSGLADRVIGIRAGRLMFVADSGAVTAGQLASLYHG